MRVFHFAALATILLVSTATARAETLIGLTNLQELVTFDSASRTVTTTTSLVGFGIGGELMLGIDVRPATGQLYGISSTNQLYAINQTTGAATAIGAPIAGLTGSAKAIDFNPTVDRIRVVSSNGQNFRVHPDTGAVTTDTSLAFGAGDTNAGDTPRIVAGAYTNSFAGATTTTLYDLDATNDILTTQLPPNDGVLNTIGPLGFNVVESGGFTGFDISGNTGTAYLVGNSLFGGGLTVNSLYTINLATGAASLAGPVSGINGSFRDVAVAVPEPGSFALAALGIASVWLLRRRVSRAS